MNSQLIEEASRVVPKVPELINLVSRRVRQLFSSARPLVEVKPGVDIPDVALTEIIEGKVRILRRSESPKKKKAA